MKRKCSSPNQTMRPWQRSLRRLRQERPAWISLWFIVLFVGAGVLTLPFSLSWYDHQSLQQVCQRPVLSSPVAYDELAARAAPAGGKGWLPETLFDLGGVLGFDSLGRSLLFRCLLGGVISLAIGFFAAGLSITLGVVWGASAALLGGRADLILMRIVDVLYGLPYILLVILLKVALDAPLTRLFEDSRLSNLVLLFVAIGANSWLTMARVIRGQVLSLKAQPFIEAAATYGAGGCRILRRHLLPNLIGPTLVYGSLIVPQAILSESFLSFLGIGIQRPLPTWGALVADGLHAVNPVVNYWWLLVFPGVMLSLTLLALNLIGDGLRSAFDPKDKM